MKKFFSLMMVVMALGMFTVGCGGDDAAAPADDGAAAAPADDAAADAAAEEEAGE